MLQDSSISTRERQLLTDERLTPGSGSVSRGNNLHPTQSPPSSGRGPGGSPRGCNDDLSDPKERQAADRDAPSAGLPGFPRLDGEALGNPPLIRGDVADGKGAMKPLKASQDGSGADHALDTGVASEAAELPHREATTPESPLFRTPVETEAGREANSPGHTPSSQTQSLYQSQGEQAGSQRTPGSTSQVEKDAKTGGRLGSSPQSRSVAFQLRLSNSSSSLSKSPGSEKLSQTGALMETGLRGQGELGGGHSPIGGAVRATGTAGVEKGRVERGGGRAELDGGGAELDGQKLGVAGSPAELAREVAELGSERRESAKRGVETRGEPVGLDGERTGLVGGTSELPSGIANEGAGTAEPPDATAELDGTAAEPREFAATEAAGPQTTAAVVENVLVSERLENQAELRSREDEGVLFVIVNKHTSAVGTSRSLEARPARERISGTLSRGRNGPEGPDPSFASRRGGRGRCETWSEVRRVRGRRSSRPEAMRACGLEEPQMAGNGLARVSVQ